MNDPTAETMLAELFEGRWPKDRNSYRLNTLLKCKPWWPPLPTVWRRREVGPEPEMAGTAYALAWPEAAALVRKLHEQYLAARRAKDSDE